MFALLEAVAVWPRRSWPFWPAVFRGWMGEESSDEGAKSSRVTRQKQKEEHRPLRIALITQPYNVQGKGRGGGAGPDALLRAGIVDRMAAQGHTVQGPATVVLTPDEEERYGGWNRVGTANGRLADLVAAARSEGTPFVLTLCADCNSVLGVLGGMTRTGESAWPRRVGLIWVDAHGDYNTPETSPSGMLGGMPVATACGKCLTRLREASGLRVPLQSPDVVMADSDGRTLSEVTRAILGATQALL